MTVHHSRITTLAVRSESCFEDLDLGAVRRFVAECDATGLDDSAVVTWDVHGDCMKRLVAEAVHFEQLSAPDTAPTVEATADGLHNGWVDPSTGLVSGGHPPVLEANDREAASR